MTEKQKKELEAIRVKYRLTKTPSIADVKEFVDTLSWPKYVVDENTSKEQPPKIEKSKVQLKSGEEFYVSNTEKKLREQNLRNQWIDPNSQTPGETWGVIVRKKDSSSNNSSNSNTDDVRSESPTSGNENVSTNGSWQFDNYTENIYQARDEYLQNLLLAQNNEFDDITGLQIKQFEQKQEDIERDQQFFQEDYNRIRSRKTQDYFTWISLQDSKFSKSLDYITNYAAQAIGSFAWIGSMRTIDATTDKMQNEERYQLNFDRDAQDSATQKSRTDQRFQIGKNRLLESKDNYKSSREKEKKVGNIETSWEVNRYYDNLIGNKILAEDEQTRNARGIYGWGTWIEGSFNY